MDIFGDLPEELKMAASLATDRGTWIRVGTFLAGLFMILIGTLIFIRNTSAAKAVSSVAGTVAKGVALA